jgi:hypothetical protein
MARSENNPLLRLHEIQILLKREAILYSESESRLAARQSGERDSSLQLLSSRKLIFASYQILLLKNPPPGLIRPFCKVMLQCARHELLSLRPTDADVSRFANVSSLPGFCIDFLKTPEGDADLLTFSLVP